ncbi:MAG: acyl carrier protein [Atopobiaceae bacterium]|nr:acyl carrier protein [Atopobiaceae bacterium]MBR3315455.1 acyl carrier protein [Atopobiaceae bacterium]
MANQELLEQLAEFAKVAYQYDGEITADTTFDELGKGSMKMIALTSTIENELDAEVTIHEVMTMKTFGELVDRVEEEMDE